MPIPVSDILIRCGHVLQDVAHTRWTTAELLLWITDGAREVVVRKPSAGSATLIKELTAGTRQTIEPAVVQILNVPRNMGMDGITPGRAIRRIEHGALDAIDPNWHTSKPSSVIRHFAYDDRVSSSFFVYPPAVAGARVEVEYSQAPAPVTAVDQQVGLDPIYLGALVNFVAFRAFSKDAEEGSLASASAYYAAFNDGLTTQTGAAVGASPNAQAAS